MTFRSVSKIVTQSLHDPLQHAISNHVSFIVAILFARNYNKPNFTLEPMERTLYTQTGKRTTISMQSRKLLVT